MVLHGLRSCYRTALRGAISSVWCVLVTCDQLNSKEYAHARREAAHFANEVRKPASLTASVFWPGRKFWGMAPTVADMLLFQALRLANSKDHGGTHANRVPDQLTMTDSGADRCVATWLHTGFLFWTQILLLELSPEIFYFNVDAVKLIFWIPAHLSRLQGQGRETGGGSPSEFAAQSFATVAQMDPVRGGTFVPYSLTAFRARPSWALKAIVSKASW